MLDTITLHVTEKHLAAARRLQNYDPNYRATQDCVVALAAKDALPEGVFRCAGLDRLVITISGTDYEAMYPPALVPVVHNFDMRRPVILPVMPITLEVINAQGDV
jgi:hypothetical protein